MFFTLIFSAMADGDPKADLLALYYEGRLDPAAARQLAVELRPTRDPSPDDLVLHTSMVVLGNAESDRLQGNDQLVLEQLRLQQESWVKFSQDPQFADSSYVTELAGVAAYAMALQGAACPRSDAAATGGLRCAPDEDMDTIRHIALAGIAETVDRSVLREADAAGRGVGLEEALFQEFLPAHPEQPPGTFVPVPADDSDAALRYYVGRHHETQFRLTETVGDEADLEAAREHHRQARESLEQAATVAHGETLQAKSLLHLAELHSAWSDNLGSGGMTLEQMNLAVLRAAEALVYADALGQVEENRARHLLGERLLRVIDAEMLRRESYERALGYVEWLKSLRDLRDGEGLNVCAWERAGVYESGESKDVRPRTASHWSHLPAERCVLQGKVQGDFAGFYYGAEAAAALHAREEGTVTGQYQGQLIDLTNRTVEAIHNALSDERLSEPDRVDIVTLLQNLSAHMSEVEDTGETDAAGEPILVVHHPLEYQKSVEAIRRLQKELEARPPFEIQPETGLDVGLQYPLPAPRPKIEDRVDGELLTAAVTRRHMDAIRDVNDLVYVPTWLAYTVDQIVWESRGDDLASPSRIRTQIAEPLRHLDAALGRFEDVEEVRSYVRERGAQLGTTPVASGRLPAMGSLGFVVVSYDSESELDAYALSQDVSTGLDQPTTWGLVTDDAAGATTRMLATLAASAFRESVRHAPSGPRYGLWYTRIDDHAVAITLPAQGDVLLRQNRGKPLALHLELTQGSGTLLQLQDNIIEKPWFHE